MRIVFDCVKAKECHKYKVNIGNPYPEQSPCNHCADYEQPPKYDVAKVIEELELHSFELGTDIIPIQYVRLKDAIEIVKRGGKNE